MRLACSPEILLDAEVQLDRAEFEPAPATRRQRLGIGDFGHAQQTDIKSAGLILAAARHGQLDVVDPDDHFSSSILAVSALPQS